MKPNRIPHFLRNVLAALGFLWVAASIPAATNIVIPFDTADEVSQWSHWWGGPAYTLQFDSAVDADGNAGSGSMKVTVNLDLVTYGPDNQFCFLRNLAQSVDGTQYTNMVMDVLVDPTTPQRPWGDFGALEFGIRHDDWSQDYFGNMNLPTNGGWIHLNAAVPAYGDPSTSSVAGLTFKMWSGDSSWGQSGTMVFWVDNMKLLAKPPPPPMGTNIVNAFDDASEVDQWTHWWGAAGWTKEFDPTVDANNDPFSGSMKITINYDVAAHGGDNQFCFLRNINGSVDGTLYSNMVMDVLVDPSSPQRPWGDFGNLEYGIRHTDWSQDYFANMNLPTNGGWVHLSGPVPLDHALITDIAGLTFKSWSGDATWGQTGTYVFWVDNIKLVAKGSNAPPIPPPTMNLTPVGPNGLHIFASTSGQYQRESIRTLNPVYSWLPAISPVTFSVTIADYPDKSHSGFQTHIFLLPAPSPVAATDSAPDWDQPNIVFVQISNNDDGSAGIRFMYKTNQPAGNSMLWNTDPAAGPVGTLATLWSPKPLGTWSVTFGGGQSDITLTAPNGATTNFTMPSESVALFANPVYAYFGIQPNNVGNLGQSATLSRIQITGDPFEIAGIDETFPGPDLDLNTWEVSAEGPAGLAIISDLDAYWLTWTLPDNGYSVQWSQTLERGSWAAPDPALPAAILNNGVRTTLVPWEGLPTPTCYFRLLKPTPP